MSFDVMRVRLQPVWWWTPSELVVEVVSVRKLSSCPFCGRSCPTVAIRDLENGAVRTQRFV